MSCLQELRTEQMPPKLLAPSTSFVSTTASAFGGNDCKQSSDQLVVDPSASLDSSEIDDVTLRTIEACLKQRIQDDDCVAYFQLGQLYFEQTNYVKALAMFEKASLHGDIQGTFQMAVILYDGLVSEREDIKLGMKYMMEVAQCKDAKYESLVRAAQYNIGRSYYMGFGVRQNNQMAEQFWLLAAGEGSQFASIKAQTALGLFYSQEKQYNNSFFWHSEACGNGSLESQGALGVMHLTGAAGKVDCDSAFICLREAATRGNVFASGHMVAYYFKRKLYTKAVDLAIRVSDMTNIEDISLTTDCVVSFIAKGVAMAAFYYGRCCDRGLSVQKDHTLAQHFYSLAYTFCPHVTAVLQAKVQHGEI